MAWIVLFVVWMNLVGLLFFVVGYAGCLMIWICLVFVGWVDDICVCCLLVNSLLIVLYYVIWFLFVVVVDLVCLIVWVSCLSLRLWCWWLFCLRYLLVLFVFALGVVDLVMWFCVWCLIMLYILICFFYFDLLGFVRVLYCLLFCWCPLMLVYCV